MSALKLSDGTPVTAEVVDRVLGFADEVIESLREAREEDSDLNRSCLDFLEVRPLLVASPDLLEALEECITSEGAACFGDMKNHPEWMQRRLYAISDIARAAIAKFNGGAQ